MAEDEKDTDNESEERPEKEKKKIISKNLIIIAVLGLVLVGVSVGGTIFALKMFGSSPAAEGEEVLEEAQAEPAASPAIYYPLKPALIITYQAKGRHRYAQIGITLMFRDEDLVGAIELHKPMILNSLNMIISGQNYQEVQTAEGKEILRLQCLEELQRLMQQEIGKPGIEQVLFTDFVMQ